MRYNPTLRIAAMPAPGEAGQVFAPRRRTDAQVTVRELIEALLRCPLDAIAVTDQDGVCYAEIDSVIVVSEAHVELAQKYPHHVLIG